MNQISSYNYNKRNEKILFNNKNISQPRNPYNLYNNQNKPSINNINSQSTYSNNYNNISIYDSKYSSTSSNPNQTISYKYNKNIRNVENGPLKKDHNRFMRRYYPNNKEYNYNNNNCIYCKLEKENKNIK